MSRTEAENRAIRKYDKEKVDRIVIRVPKGKRELIQQHAKSQNESVNAFINRAITYAIKNNI